MHRWLGLRSAVRSKCAAAADSRADIIYTRKSRASSHESSQQPAIITGPLRMCMAPPLLPQIVIVYALSCVKDPARLALSRLLVALGTYITSATLAYTAAAAAVSRAPLRHHQHAAIHCRIDAAAANAALEKKLASRQAARAARAAAASDAEGDDDDDDDDDVDEVDELLRTACDSSDEGMDADEEEDDDFREVLMRRRMRSACGGLAVEDIGVPGVQAREGRGLAVVGCGSERAKPISANHVVGKAAPADPGTMYQRLCLQRFC